MSLSGAQVYADAFGRGWRPEPRILPSWWADQHRVMGNRSGSAEVKWNTAETPYLKEIMDNLGPRSAARRVVFMKGSQIGGTEAGLNWIGFIMHHTPGPILILRPTVEDARRFSRQRLDPMIKTTPALRGLVTEARAREGGNSLLTKEFPGGVLFLVGSNSSTGVKSMPIRWLFCDEVDEYPGDVRGQGDPIALAEKRCTGPVFSRRKVYLCSTPTIKGLSRIENEYEASDQRRYYIPCPHCHHMDWLQWRIGGRDGKQGHHHHIAFDERDALTTRMVCSGCGQDVPEHHKPWMLANGEWRATATSSTETIGYHISSLYSPLGWFPWSAVVKEFLKCGDDQMKLKNWVNSVLGESWEEKGETIDANSLKMRVERYEAEVPHGVGILVAAVDVQDTWLDLQVKGYGDGEESWLVAHHQIYGDPSQNDVWFQCDEFLKQEFTHASGQKMKIECTIIDSGGHYTDEVYRFCKARQSRRIFAGKGGGEEGKPLIGAPSRGNRYRTPLFVMSVDTGKEIVHRRLCNHTPGPGYIHLPEWVTDEYVDQLVSEKAITVYHKKRGSMRVWTKLRDRNEAFDLEVYCLAALYIMGIAVIKDLAKRAAKWSQPLDGGTAAPPPRPGAPTAPVVGPAAARPSLPPRQTGWLHSWKRGR